jgi:hypothetical protein
VLEALAAGARAPPTLLEICVREIVKNIGRQKSFAGVPRDLIQQVLDELVRRQLLGPATLGLFSECALMNVLLADYPGLEDYWLEVLGSQGDSLLALDISSSTVSDEGLALLKACTNLESLILNSCEYISDEGLPVLSGLSNLTTLSLRSNNSITAAGMSNFNNLVSLKNLDLERCPLIQGGFVHLKGLTTLEKLNVGWCIGVRNSDIKHLAGLVNLEDLQISRSKVGDFGIAALAGLTKLRSLSMEGCQSLTARGLESIAGTFGIDFFLDISLSYMLTT